MMSEMVRCKDCGYFSVRRKEDGVIVSADDQFRECGTIRDIPGKPYWTMYDPIPLCYVGASNLKEEMSNIGALDRIGVGERLKECTQFIRHIPGLSPGEHREMRLLQEVETRTQRWEQQQEALSETRHQELRRDAKRLAWLGIIGAIISGILSGLASSWFTSNH